jgi:hypothetical protein
MAAFPQASPPTPEQGNIKNISVYSGNRSRFEAAMAMMIVIKVFCYMTSYRLESRHKCFGGAGSILIQDLAIKDLTLCQYAKRHIS